MEKIKTNHCDNKSNIIDIKKPKSERMKAKSQKEWKQNHRKNESNIIKRKNESKTIERMKVKSQKELKENHRKNESKILEII